MSDDRIGYAERLINSFIGLLVGILVIVFLGIAALVVVGLYAIHPMLAWTGTSILIIGVILGGLSAQ